MCVSIIDTHGKRDSNAWVSSDPIPWLFLLASGAGEGSKQKWVALQSWTYLLKQFSQIVRVPFSSWLQAIRPVLSQADFHRHNKQEDTNKGLPGLLHSVREKNIFLIIMTFKAQFSSYSHGNVTFCEWIFGSDPLHPSGTVCTHESQLDLESLKVWLSSLERDLTSEEFGWRSKLGFLSALSEF